MPRDFGKNNPYHGTVRRNRDGLQGQGTEECPGPEIAEWRSRSRPAGAAPLLLDNSHNKVCSLMDNDSSLSRSLLSQMDIAVTAKRDPAYLYKRLSGRCRKAAPRLAQLFFKFLYPTQGDFIVFPLRTIRDVDVGSDVVRRKPAAGCVRDACKIIERLVLEPLILVVSGPGTHPIRLGRVPSGSSPGARWSNTVGPRAEAL